MTTFTQNLLDWYLLHKRDLPWRSQVQIYQTWVCEVMSQQTTLAVVLPRFSEFIKTLPTVEHLAACPEDTLRQLWKGLGYYARARNLKKAANVIVESGQGFPKTYQDWLKLPGCGQYTAAVIASVCYGEPVACIDGNVIRVTSRLLGLTDEAWRKEGQQKIATYVNAHISSSQPGDFNQAMMDLGATLCKKNNPECCWCPVSPFCLAYRNGTVRLCPSPKPKKDFKREDIFVFLFCRAKSQERLLIERKHGFLAKTRGFPILSSSQGFSFEKIKAVLSASGFQGKTHYTQNAFQHTITHHKITAHIIWINADQNQENTQDHFFTALFPVQEKKEWIAFSDLKNHVSSSLDLKVLNRKDTPDSHKME